MWKFHIPVHHSNRTCSKHLHDTWKQGAHILWSFRWSDSKYVEIRYSIYSKTMLILLCKPQVCWLRLTIVCATVPAHRSMFVYIYEVRVVTGKHQAKLFYQSLILSYAKSQIHIGLLKIDKQKIGVPGWGLITLALLTISGLDQSCKMNAST